MATEILRPTAGGDECNINSHNGGSACPNHWDNVDEAVPDDWATCVYNAEVAAYQRDLYNIANSGVGAGTINWVTVYAVCFEEGGPGFAKIAIKAGTGAGAPDTVDLSVEKALTNFWVPYSKIWAINPSSAGAWTWAEIDNLQIGISLKTQPGAFAECTQVYAEVSYGDLYSPATRSALMGAKMVAGKLI